MELGAKAPDFSLLGVDGKRYSLKDFNKPVLVIIFSCNHCPYVQAFEDRIIAIARDYRDKVQIVAINSNDEKAYPEDDYEHMVERAKKKGFNFPYLRDKEQTVVSAYGAVCTPHVFGFDKDRRLRYQGRIDDSKDPKMVKSNDLRNALDDLIAGKEVRTPLTRAFGCSIKWFIQ
ncbi:MAG: thioredoxin family protein [Thaumarchaeota archaeon]|nr:thioredoxin family protein [Nitrososphaerota archaeon]